MHDGDSVDREGHAALLRREGVGQDGLLAGLKAAAACALEDAEEDQQCRASAPVRKGARRR